MAVMISNLVILVILTVASTISVAGLVIGSVAYQRTTEEATSQEQRDFSFPLKSTVTGSASEPAYTFEASMNTGIFLQNTSLGISSNGSELARFGEGLRIENGVTGEADPSLVLDVNSTVKGARFCPMSTTQRDDISSPVTGSLIYNTNSNAYQYYNGSSWLGLGGGTAVFPLTANLSTRLNPEYTFIGQTTTGMYSDGLNVNLSVNGVQAFTTVENQILIRDGSDINTPGLAFIGETDLGFRRSAEGVITYSADGADTLQIDANGIAVPDGSTPNPTYSFFSNSGTGMWSDMGGDRIRFSFGGLARVTMQKTGINCQTYRSEIPTATSQPFDDNINFRFNSNGLYFPINGFLGLATGGVNGFFMDSNQAISMGDFSNLNATTNLPDSVLLTLNATDRALQLTRMSVAQRDAIATPLEGLITYLNNSSNTYLSYYIDNDWVEMGVGSFGATYNALLGVDICPTRVLPTFQDNICIGGTIATNATTSRTFIVIGNNSATTSADISRSIVIGSNAGREVSTDSVIIGSSAKLTGTVLQSVCIGSDVDSGNSSNSVIIGFDSYGEDNCVAIGRGSSAEDNCISIGSDCTTSFTTTNSITIGTNSTLVAAVSDTIVFGSNISINNSTNSICFGQQVQLNGNALNNTVLLGNSNTVTGAGTLTNTCCVGQNISIGVLNDESCVFGNNISASGQNNVIIGESASNISGSFRGVAVGSESVVNTGCIAIGYRSILNLNNTNSILIGANTSYSGNETSSVVVGNNIVAQSNSVLIGNSWIGLSPGNDNTIVGHAFNNAGVSSVANSVVIGRGLGTNNSTTMVMVGLSIQAINSDNSVILGANSLQNNAANSVTIGQAASSTAASNVIIGQAASSSAASNVIIGQAASSDGASNIIIGQGGSNIAATTQCVGVGDNVQVGADSIAIGFSTGNAANGNSCIYLGPNQGNNAVFAAVNNAFALGVSATDPLLSGNISIGRLGVGSSGGLLPAPGTTSGDHGLYIQDSTTAPVGTVSGGGILYGQTQELKYLDSAGNDRFVLNQTYTSPNQTITTAGTFTVNHGLTARPNQVSYFLECTVAEVGYSVGDIVQVSVNNATAGFTALLTSTQITVRFNNAANVFTLFHLGDGNITAITNGSWEFFIVASYMD